MILKKICLTILIISNLANAQLLQSANELSIDDIQVLQIKDQLALEIIFQRTSKNNVFLDLFIADQSKAIQEIPRFNEAFALTAIKLSPPVPFTISNSKNGLLLLGQFSPQTEYSIGISDRLQDQKGYKLKKAFYRTILTGDLKPQFHFLNKARFLPPQLQQKIPYESINTKEVEISIRQIYSQNIHQLLSTKDAVGNNLSDVIKVQKINTKFQLNKKYRGLVSFDDIKALGEGIFYIEAKNDEGPLDSTVLIITELGAIIKLGEDNTLKIWTLKNTSLKPITDVEVTLNSESNFKLGSCRTQGSKAYCEIKWTNSSKKPFAVSLKKAKDQSYMRLSDLDLNTKNAQSDLRPFLLKNQQDLDAFVFSQRNLYRLGETITLSAMIRELNGDAAKNAAILWKIRRPDGEIFREYYDKISGMGLVDLEFPTQLNFPEGIYTVEIVYKGLSIGSFQFKLETFVPEYLTAHLRAEKDLNLGNLKAKFNLSVNKNLGNENTPVIYNIHCSLEEAYTALPKFSYYRTGTYQLAGKQKLTIENIKGVLKNNKGLNFTCDFQKFAEQLPNTIYKITAEANLAEQGNPLVMQTKTDTVAASKNINIGIKATHDAENNLVQIDGLITDLTGATLNENRKIKLELIQIQENWIQQQIDEKTISQWNLLETLSTKSINKVIETKAGFLSAYLTPPLDWKKWIVRATDIASNMTAEVLMQSILVADELKPSEDLKIEVNQSSVIPGQSLAVKIIPPFKGDLLLGVESNKIHETQWLRVDQLNPITISIKAPDVKNNFYITGLLFKTPFVKNNQYISPRAWGVKTIQVVPQKQTLNIQLEVPEKLEALKTYKIKIKNREKIRSEYSIFITDENLQQASSYQLTNPIQRFFDQRALNAKTLESLNVKNTLESSAEEINKIFTNPISGTLNRLGRNFFQVKIAKLSSNQKGEAEFQINLPHFQGRLNFYVIGSALKHSGSTSLVKPVQDSFDIKLDLPNYLTIGDHAPLNITAQNNNVSAGSLNVSLGTLGPVEIAKLNWDFLLKPDEVTNIQEPLNVLDLPFPAQLSLKKTSSPAVNGTIENITLPIYSNGIEKFLFFTNRINEKLNLITALPPNWKKNHLNIHLQLSNFPYLGLFAYLNTLWNSNYSGLDQKISKILPLIGNEDLLLLNSHQLPKLTLPEIKSRIQQIIDSIMDQQCTDGGIAFWPNQNSAHPWGSAYTALALLEAKKKGYRVSEFAWQQLQKYLAESVKSSIKNWQWSENDNPELMLNIFILTQLKKNTTQDLKIIFKNNPEFKQKNIEDFAYENLFLLSVASQLSQQAQLANKINKDKGLNKKVFSEAFYQKAFSAKNFWSPLRTDGLRLGFLLDHWPDHPAISTLLERITTQLVQPKMFFNSQDLSWSLWALVKLLNKTRIDVNHLKDVILTFNEKSIPPDFFVRGIPVWNFSGDELISSSFSFNPFANKQMTFNTMVSGYTMGPPPSLSPITVERAYLLPDGSEADETDLKLGDKLIVELKVFNPRSIPFRGVALVDRIPAGFEIDLSGPAAEFSPWMNKSLMKVDHVDLQQNKIQVFGEITDTEKYYYYHVRAKKTGKFKAPAAMLELMYLPESFDFSSENTINISN